jgi:hypothetical protein
VARLFGGKMSDQGLLLNSGSVRFFPVCFSRLGACGLGPGSLPSFLHHLLNTNVITFQVAEIDLPQARASFVSGLISQVSYDLVLGLGSAALLVAGHPHVDAARG